MLQRFDMNSADASAVSFTTFKVAFKIGMDIPNTKPSSLPREANSPTVSSRELDWKTHDGVDVHATYVSPPHPVAGIVLTHGWGDHQGRYTDLINYLTGQGYSVLAHDLRGHGHSGGKRGYGPSMASFRDDLRLGLENARQLNPLDLPLFLYGQSFGGLLTLNFLIHNQQSVQSDPQLFGALITSPLLGLAMKVPTWKLVTGKLASFVVPQMTLRSGIDAKQLSQRDNYAAKIASDPLRHGRISVGHFFEMKEAMQWTINRAAQLPCPTMILHGDADRITSSASSRALVDRSAGKAEIRIWSNMLHELHAEIDNQLVFAFIDHWIKRQLNPRNVE